MNTAVRRKLEMAARVREFIRSRSSTEPGYATALARFEESLTRAGAIAARQHEGRTAERAARAQRKELRRVLHFQLIRYLVAVGSLATKDRTELAERFKLPDSGGSNSVFLTTVKALLALAGTEKDLLVQQGMMPTLLDDLAGMVTKFETALEAIRTGRRDHIGARADLNVITAELVDQVKVLDGITRYRFGDDPEVMAEWKAVRRVPGQPQAEVTPPPTGDGVVPPTSGTGGGVAPAA
jgi:hypothetical protein